MVTDLTQKFKPMLRLGDVNGRLGSLATQAAGNLNNPTGEDHDGKRYRDALLGREGMWQMPTSTTGTLAPTQMPTGRATASTSSH
eukprot:8375531-Pyramimonas_sp.AAC.1